VKPEAAHLVKILNVFYIESYVIRGFSKVATRDSLDSVLASWRHSKTSMFFKTVILAFLRTSPKQLSRVKFCIYISHHLHKLNLILFLCYPNSKHWLVITLEFELQKFLCLLHDNFCSNPLSNILYFVLLLQGQRLSFAAILKRLGFINVEIMHLERIIQICQLPYLNFIILHVGTRALRMLTFATYYSIFIKM
jgi:hypothetical protein